MKRPKPKRRATYTFSFSRKLFPMVLVVLLAAIVFPFITAEMVSAPTELPSDPPKESGSLFGSGNLLSASDYYEPETTASRDLGGGMNSSEDAMAGLASLFPFFVPLYSKLKPDSVLSNHSRGQLYNLVSSQPGITFGTLARTLNIAPGTAEYHLRILEREGYIRARKTGKFIRYYPYEMRTCPYTPVQQKILNSLAIEPDQSQTALAEKVGVSKQVVNYNIKQLREFGVLDEQKSGTKLICRLTAQSPYSPQVF